MPVDYKYEQSDSVQYNVLISFEDSSFKFHLLLICCVHIDVLLLRELLMPTDD